jgi:YD repeat-containing protein
MGLAALGPSLGAAVADGEARRDVQRPVAVAPDDPLTLGSSVRGGHRGTSTLVPIEGVPLTLTAAYTLDADGNRTSLRTAAGVESYTVNAVDQLTSVSYSDGVSAAYTYDAAGNRLTARTGSGPVVDYAYDAASQLVAVDEVAVQHDAAGNVTRAPDGASYGWDWLSRMTSVTGAGGEQTGYGYDGDGVRVAQTVGGSTSELVYDRYSADGVADLVESDAGSGAGSGAAAYVHGPGGVLEHAQGGTTSFPLVDALGSVRTVTDAAGAVTGRASYDVFGAVRSSSGDGIGLGYAGAPQAGGLRSGALSPGRPLPRHRPSPPYGTRRAPRPA